MRKERLIVVLVERKDSRTTYFKLRARAAAASLCCKLNSLADSINTSQWVKLDTPSLSVVRALNQSIVAPPWSMLKVCVLASIICEHALLYRSLTEGKACGRGPLHVVERKGPSQSNQ